MGELTFSIDLSGPTISTPSSGTGAVITDGDLLVRRGDPFGPEAPQIALSADFLSRYLMCGGHLPGNSCGLEINALSFGRDTAPSALLNHRFHVLFSVDEFALGRPNAAGTPGTNLFREAQSSEAAGDLFFSSLQGVAPFQFVPNRAYADGNGARAQQGQGHVFGLGLVEPILPDQGTVDSGDNLDAINYGAAFDPAVHQLFFSLEGAITRCGEPGLVFDAAGAQPLLGTTINARAADVLLFTPGAPLPSAYARANQLGLDRTMPGIDDIDALIVVENGVAGYQQPQNLYDWDGLFGSDLILFSVRCGSDIVGETDQVSGRVIGEGDILVKLQGPQGSLPQVFIPAEALGLRSTEAGNMANDELNGLDIFDDDEVPFLDCNSNGVDDAVDISYMTSDDTDNNGIPDECEDDWSSVCDCSMPASAPCGNNDAVGRGCRNVTGVGGRLRGGGTTSVTSDSLLLVVDDLFPGSLAIGFAGLSLSSTPLFNGRFCVQPTGPRLGRRFADGSGGLIQGPGLLAAHPLTLMAMSGSTYYFQFVYRDSPGACLLGGNVTNALRVLFTP